MTIQEHIAEFRSEFTVVDISGGTCLKMFFVRDYTSETIADEQEVIGELEKFLSAKITQVRNEALEKAAKVAKTCPMFAEGGYADGYRQARIDIAADIRKLKA